MGGEDLKIKPSDIESVEILRKIGKALIALEGDQLDAASRWLNLASNAVMQMKNKSKDEKKENDIPV